MCAVSGSFCFHNVGQGGFYTGRIKSDTNKFFFIYDCGTFSPHKFMTDAIRDFGCSMEGEEKLDLLVLSHMDTDHVNGVSDLLERCNIHRIDVLVMPYMTLSDRAILLAYYSKRKQDDNSSWYYEFLIDPIGFFFSRDIDIRYIVFACNGENEHNERNDAILSFDKAECIFWGKENNDKANTLREENHKIGQLANRVYCVEDFKISYCGLWKFDFWCDYRNIRTDIHERVINNIYALGLDISDVTRVKDLFAHKRRELADCYGETKIAPNDMSVILLHYPIIEGFFSQIDVEVEKPFAHVCLLSSLCHSLINRHSTKTLLLGDINLQSTLEEIWTYFNLTNMEDELLVCTVPHHGSKYSWNNEILSRCENTIFVVSSCVHGRFKHPHYIVVKDFLAVLILHYYGIMNMQKYI